MRNVRFALVVLMLATLTACGAAPTRPTETHKPHPAWVDSDVLPDNVGPGVAAWGIAKDPQEAEFYAKGRLAEKIFDVTEVSPNGKITVEAKGMLYGVRKIAKWENGLGDTLVLFYVSRADLERSLQYSLLSEEELRNKLDILAPLTPRH